MVIDWEHHISTEASFRRRNGVDGQMSWGLDEMGRGRGLVREEIYRVDRHIEFMDTAGIDMAVISSFPGKAAELRSIVELFAKLMKDYPDRFVCLAPVDPLSSQGLDQMVWAIKNMGLRGVCLSSVQQGNTFMDSRKMWPFYEIIAKLDVPIYIHVGEPQGYEALYSAPYNLAVSLVREYDLAVTAVRLVLSGVLAEFPGLKFVISHMGGGISAVMERLIRYIRVWDDKFWAWDKKHWQGIGKESPLDKPYAENFQKYFNKLYFDMAGYEGGMNAVKCALTTIKPERLLFGSDYYPNFTGSPDGAKDAADCGKYIEHIKALDLPEETIDDILAGNAKKLLSI
ncbi:MAG: amidohydrolase [Anaerolineales bacterium]|nr:amidohydrolase [Anaerolineales bacterium]